MCCFLFIIQMWKAFIHALPVPSCPVHSFPSKTPAVCNSFGCSRRNGTTRAKLWVSLCIMSEKVVTMSAVFNQSCRSNRIKSLLKAMRKEPMPREFEKALCRCFFASVTP